MPITELAKITAIRAGAIYFTVMPKSFFIENFSLPSFEISFAALFIPHTYPVRIHINKPPRGMIILSEKKLKNSNRLVLPILISGIAPTEREANIPAMKMSRVTITAAHIRVSFVLLQTHATITSSSEIDEVSAAKSTSIKNTDETTLPPFICEKIAGRVLKINPKPSVGAKPKEKTAGRIVSPEIMAIAVSRTTMVTVLEVRLLSLGR